MSEIFAICRHRPGDPNCSSTGGYWQDQYRNDSAAHEKEMKEVKAAHKKEIDKIREEVGSLTPDSKNYEIEKVEFINNNIVMQVRYPSCKACSYEGLKIIVFLGVSATAAMKWKEIDPHFREPGSSNPYQAPSPSARFPGTEDGWKDAIEYVQRK